MTGGSRGIGRAVAEALAGAGADVVVASRKLDNCETAAREITEATGRRALPVACHVGKWEECDRLVETVYGEFGRCDVLVNNAGMSPAYDGLASVERGALRQGACDERPGAVPAQRADRGADGPRRRRVDHQHLLDRVPAPQHHRPALRHGQGSPERPDPRAGRRLGAEGAGEPRPAQRQPRPT